MVIKRKVMVPVKSFETNQGDQMRFWQNCTRCSPSHFMSKLIHIYLFPSCAKIWAIHEYKLPRVNNGPIGESSPNLVTPKRTKMFTLIDSLQTKFQTAPIAPLSFVSRGNAAHANRTFVTWQRYTCLFYFIHDLYYESSIDWLFTRIALGLLGQCFYQ
jgi:hypothetical protein